MNNWLDRFRDDPRKQSGAPRKPGAPAPRSGGWLDKFRDDPRPKAQQPRPQQPQPPRPSQPVSPNERPQSIMLFGALMGVSLVFGLTGTAIAYPKLAPFASPVEILLPDIMVIALIGGLVFLVWGMKQQWAVWLLAVFCAVRFLLYVPTFLHIDAVTVRLLTACYFILQAAAFWFVFTPEARRWLGTGRS